MNENSIEYLHAIVKSANGQESDEYLEKIASRTVAERVVQGRNEMRSVYPDLAWKLDKVAPGEDKLAFSFTAAGTHRETQKSSSWCGTGVAYFDKEGLIKHLSIFEDHRTRLIDLGIVPKTPEQDISGTWRGSVWGIDFTLYLTQNERSPDFEGQISGLGHSLPVDGSNEPPNVQFSVNTPKGQVSFAGEWENDKVISGILNGAGFKNERVKFTRS